jgi:hypothetical protein
MSEPWICCDDAMPDADEAVMIYHPAADEPVWLGFFDGDDWRDVGGNLADVSHWRELPEPPVEKKEVAR